jgi:hypothetical protein
MRVAQRQRGITIIGTLFALFPHLSLG